MRTPLAVVLAALSVFLALPVCVAHDADPPDELPDVGYRCVDDVPEADAGLVEMACEDEPTAEPMSKATATMSLQTSCTFCSNFCKGNSACFSCCCFGYC